MGIGINGFVGRVENVQRDLTTQKMNFSIKDFLSKGTAQKVKFSVKDFFSKCDQIRSVMRIWSHLLKKSLTENFTFCTVHIANIDNPCK